MLESLTLQNFSAFAQADFRFAPGLNLIVGENGTGKSHVLKVAYSALHVLQAGVMESPSKPRLQTKIAGKLVWVFRVDDTGTIDALQEELSQSDRYLETEPSKCQRSPKAN